MSFLTGDARSELAVLPGMDGDSLMLLGRALGRPVMVALALAAAACGPAPEPPESAARQRANGGSSRAPGTPPAVAGPFPSARIAGARSST